MQLEKIQELIFEKLTNQITQQDEEILSKWLAESESNKEHFNSFLKIFDNSKKLKNKKIKVDLTKNYLQLQGKIKKRRKAIKLKKISWLIAASIIPLAIVFTLLKQGEQIQQNKIDHTDFSMIMPGKKKAILKLSNGKQINLSTNKLKKINDNGVNIVNDSLHFLKYNTQHNSANILKYNELYVPIGGEFYVELSDGTQVWLNSKSKIIYPIKFIGNQRKVKIIGEAFFKVKKSTLPFIVETPNTKIKVLGTQFNIKAYQADKHDYTTLVEGKVLVSNTNKQSLTLLPGYQVKLNRKSQKLSNYKVQTEKYISWIKGLFVFKKMRLEDIAIQLERWYDIDIFFLNEKIKNKKFTGVIKKENPIEYIINMIETTTNVQFKIINKRQLMVSEK